MDLRLIGSAIETKANEWVSEVRGRSVVIIIIAVP